MLRKIVEDIRNFNILSLSIKKDFGKMLRKISSLKTVYSDNTVNVYLDYSNRDKILGYEFQYPNINLQGEIISDNITYKFSYTTADKEHDIDVNFIFVDENEFTTWNEFMNSKEPNDFAHKTLLRALTAAVSSKPAIVLTPGADCSNYKNKLKKHQPGEISILKLSIDNGIVISHEPLECDGVHLQLDGLYLWKEAQTLSYETNLENVFRRVFGIEPTEDDVNKMYNYIGLIDLVETYLSSEIQFKIYNKLFDLFFKSKRNVGLDKSVEFEEKMAAMSLYNGRFLDISKDFESRKLQLKVK